jgi:hypothetical protein
VLLHVWVCVRVCRGAGWTAARNAPGSFALFGGSAFVKDYVFHLEKYSDATFAQVRTRLAQPRHPTGDSFSGLMCLFLL